MSVFTWDGTSCRVAFVAAAGLLGRAAFRVSLVTVAAAGVLSAAVSHATTYSGSFSASGFTCSGGCTAPTDPAIGSATITFDDSAITGIGTEKLSATIDSITLTLGGLAYTPSNASAQFWYTNGAPRLVEIYGVYLGPQMGAVSGPADMIARFLVDGSTNHTFWYHTGNSTSPIFVAGTISHTFAEVVPEPGTSLLMLVAGGVLLFAGGRRKREVRPLGAASGVLRSPASRASAVLALSLMASGGARAVPILDQSYDLGSGNAALGVTATHLAQVFEVGASGTLDRIEFEVSRNSVSNLTVEIFSAAGGVPTGPALASIVVSGVPTTFSWVSLDVSVYGIAVAPGDLLALVLSVPTTGPVYQYAWAAGFDSAGDPLYALGDSCGSNGGPFACSATRDFHFRTYVSAVPEPGAAMLLGLGLFGLGRSAAGRTASSPRQRGSARPGRSSAR